MAELHGELMEFNEHLQVEMMRRDTQINKMRQELIALRGPVSSCFISQLFLVVQFYNWKLCTVRQQLSFQMTSMPLEKRSSRRGRFGRGE